MTGSQADAWRDTLDDLRRRRDRSLSMGGPDRLTTHRGQGKLDGKIFRVGHLGWVQQHEVAEALDIVEKLLAEATASA